MRKRYALANAMLWAAAIIVAAALKAPPFLCLVLLPLLAARSQLTAGLHTCHHRSDIS